MKTKPTRHKETNTFKFRPFSERVNDIDVDVFHKVSHRNEEVTEETETYFYQCLQKWNFLNLSENYTNFRKEVVDIITLPQLLNRKQFVINTLLKYLRLKDPLCLQSIYELIISLAKDLQIDFYEYFPEFLSTIIDLLQTKDAEQLEHTFTTLAYLFKFQWRYMIQNIDIIFNLLLPLLSETRPVYVNNFAAESFAFVVRKVKDKKAFVKLVLGAVEKRQDRTVGCGKLLFHVLAGVAGQFHSCSGTLLAVYLNSLKDSSINQKLLFEVLSTVFHCIASEIRSQKCDILWTVVYKVLEQSSEDNLINLLLLIQILIKRKGGQLLRDPLIWSKILVQLIDKYQNNHSLLEEIANTVVTTLLAPNIKLLQETSSFLILKLLSINNQDLLLKVTEKLVSYSSFETLILPKISKNIFSALDGKLLQLLAKIIETKSPPVLSGINFDKWNKFNLKIDGEANTKFLSEQLDSLKEGEIKEDALKILIVLPHITILQEHLRSKLIESFTSLYKRIMETTDQQQRVNFAFLLAIECVVRITKPDDFYSLINELSSCSSDLLAAALLHENDVTILNALDLTYSYLKTSSHAEEYISLSTFDTLYQSLASKLGSPNSLIRLTTSHLFSLFASLPGLNYESEDPKAKSALELMYFAENEPITVHKYRDRLVRLQALDYYGPAVSHLNSRYQDCALHYLLGNLYVNFSLLWDPIIQLVASYATKECEKYWPVFLAVLKDEENVTTVEGPVFECEIVSSLAKKVFEVKDKVDRLNYKLLLWKCMGLTTSYCEVKNRDYVSLFIDFVEENFFKTNSEDAKSCSIKKREQQVVESKEITGEKLDVDKTTEVKDEESFEAIDKIEDDEKKDEDEIKDEQEEEDEDEEKDIFSKVKLTGKERTKLLLAILQVFSKFTNTRSLYREPEVLRIYQDLLSSKNSEVQKAALNCIYTYKYKYLLPYKEHMDNIVDEKNLKNELTRFQISISESTEEAAVQEEHRSGLMPILMRVLHAKMSQRVGMRTGGKTGGLVRRKTILRFLAGVKEGEMLVFVRMAFKPFQNYLPILKVDEINQSKVDLRQMVQEIHDNVDLESVIPPKRLQSAVNLLAVIIEQFGGKMTERLLPHLLAILICILAQVAGMLAFSSEVHTGYLPSIRNVRNTCINVLARFFAHFENYDWSSSEIDALFEVAVFPWLDKLPIEGIHSPTPLLKMMAMWSHNPRYYPLFVKVNKDNCTSLTFIFRLLRGPKTHKSVQRAILDIVEKLLTLQDFEKEDPDQMDVDNDIKAKSLLSIVTNKLEIKKDDTINYGSAMLLPHVTDILAFIEAKLKRQAKPGTSRTELTILSRISEFAKDPKTCDTLLTLVMPVLNRKCDDSEEVVIQLLTSVTNLIKSVENPEIHLRPVHHLLAHITTVPARKMLMQLLNEMVRNNEAMKKSQAILIELNAYDRRWIEQPDFERRLNAFVEIDEMINRDLVTLDFGVAVILNCYFFLKTENDLAMKDRSSLCLITMGTYLAKKFKDTSADRKYLIEDTIFTMIRQGIRSKTEIVKHQSIAFLGKMAMECPEIHPCLRDLNLLTNKQDPEVDFFENMQHMQQHRRVKAMLKFCSVAKSMTKSMNPKTLTQFILPLASAYLCNEKFAGKNSIIDAAIETVGIICKLLPWNQYEIVLRYYLDKLRSCVEYQKQIIRIVVIILDSFHYDLSKYKAIEEDASKDLKDKNKMKMSVNDQLEQIEATSASVEGSEKPVDEHAEETKEVSEERLHQALSDGAIDDAVDAEEAEEVTPTKDILAVERQTVLSQYMAKRLVYGITKGLLPQLHRAIAVRTRHEASHKVNKKKASTDQEEEELMRVPIGLAMVKLLQKLPHGLLDSNLKAILTKVCTFLKSRLESVRRATREILQKIMNTLGPDYLHYLLKEMNALLTRGYQVHVLVYNIHAVMVSLKPYFTPKHMRSNLLALLHACKIDLFGPSAEEKEIAGILRKVSEAKSTKSFDIFHILGEFIDEGALIDVIMPLKDILLHTHSHKTVRKITESLRQLGLGLADNKFIETKKIVDFLYGITSESIPQLMPECKNKQAEEEKEKTKTKAQQKEHCLILQPQTKRMSSKPRAKISKDTNVHVMVEFGLSLLHIFLKRDKVNDPELKPLLDSFVPHLANGVKSQHIRLSTLSLQCLSWLLKLDLPLVRSSVSDICASMFNILHKYSVAHLSKGENYDLVMASFKAMSVLVRDVKHFVITPEQLKALLIYAERDMHDSDKHATAFGLLKAIIHRKLVVQEMHPVMEKVARLSIISDLENVRKQARTVFYSYLLDYPLGKQLEKHISFYLAQLQYEEQPGRLSAISMVYNIVTGFPVEVLAQHSVSIFCNLGARLVNDDDPTCKKSCSKCIEELIDRLPRNQRNKLFEKVITWLKDRKVLTRRLAAQLCGIFVTVEKDAFESRLEKILSLLAKQFHFTNNFEDDQPGCFVKVQKEEEVPNEDIKDSERIKAHHLYVVLQLLQNIGTNCTPFLKANKYQDSVYGFAEHSQLLLAHCHLWVRLAAAQVLGIILAALDIDKVISLMQNPEECNPDDGFVYSDPIEKVRTLMLDFVGQLQPHEEEMSKSFHELYDQTIKNLIFLARLVKISNSAQESTNNKEGEDKKDISLLWLLKKLRKYINVELSQAPKSTIVRSSVFKWMAGVIATIDIELLKPILFHFMSPLAREMATIEESNAPLRQLAKEVATMIKKKTDAEEYARLLSEAQKRLNIRRAEKRKVRVQQYVTDPELAAKRKIAKQQKKKVAKKRKMETMKGKRGIRKKVKKDIDLEVM